MKKFKALNKLKKGAFSLMEMMIVLLIVSIIAAATAPMITKKMASSFRSAQSSAINYFGMGSNFGNSGKGTFLLGSKNAHGQNVKMFVSANDSNQEHIGFGVNEKNYYGLLSVKPNGRIKTGKIYLRA